MRSPRWACKSRSISKLQGTGYLLAIACSFAVAIGFIAWSPNSQADTGSEIRFEEDFTGTTAAEFLGYGSACLTGASSITGVGAGSHEIGGCSSTHAGPVPPSNASPHGYLQLTDASTDQSGAVLFRPVLDAAHGIKVSFDAWQYGATTGLPADGMSFFLVDGHNDLDDPGAFGGSLGYAEKNMVGTQVAGVTNGYLGIGFDVFGNYFNDGEGRGTGCTGANQSPAGSGGNLAQPLGANMIIVRGAGNGLSGYCYLDGTAHETSTASYGGWNGTWQSTLPGQLHGSTASVSSNAVQAETDLEPSRRTVTVIITPVPNAEVTVLVDFHDGNGAQQVLNFPAPNPVPTSYRFGFAAATGLATDVHLIRTLTGQPADPQGGIQLQKTVSSAGPYAAGSTIRYNFLVTNTGDGDLTGITIHDPLISNVSCPASQLAETTSMTCTGDYQVSATDVQQGVVNNTATATGTGITGQVSSSSTAKVTLGPELVDTGINLRTITALAVGLLAAGLIITFIDHKKRKNTAL